MEDNPFGKESLMFRQILSNDALNIYKCALTNKEECVKMEAQLRTNNKLYSSVICMMAAASVLDVKLDSMYPAIEKNDACMEFLFNGTMNGNNIQT